MKVAESLKMLEAGIDEVFKDERFLKYLSTMAKFHNYSFNNTMLIFMQKPDATHVAGYQQWKKQFNRNVKKNEHGIGIIAPCFKKEKDLNGKEITLTYFRSVTVFDISQTEGEPLSDWQYSTIEGNVRGYEQLKKSIEDVAGIPVSYEDFSNMSSKGYYSHMTEDIHIDDGLDELNTLDVLIHEVAHRRLHRCETGKDRHTKEVEAQSVAYVVGKHFGIDSGKVSFEYVASWSTGKEKKELKSSLETIANESRKLIEEIEAKLVA